MRAGLLSPRRVDQADRRSIPWQAHQLCGSERRSARLGVPATRDIQQHATTQADTIKMPSAAASIRYSGQWAALVLNDCSCGQLEFRICGCSFHAVMRPTLFQPRSNIPWGINGPVARI